MHLPDQTQENNENIPLTAKTKKMDGKSSKEHKYMPQQKSKRNYIDKQRSMPNPKP